MRLVHLRVGTAAEVDAVLDTLDTRDGSGGSDGSAGRDRQRLVLDADRAGLNLALHRLLRRGLLGSVETAVLAREPIGYLTKLGLPAARADQWQLARTGNARLVGVVKDDSGGVCLDGAELTPWTSDETPDKPWWVRAVVDDQRLCDGEVRAISVRRLGPGELQATVRLGRFRSRTCRGRSLQLACDEALIVADGLPRERPRRKRTFWSEPELWKLVTPDAGP